MAHPHYDFCVIGAGIIGLSIALRLAETGQSVILIDKKGMAEETSRGNAGALAFADIEPLASPGMILKAPKWLFDPLGPLSIPPAYAPKILPWMLRFFRASLPDRYKASTIAQAALMNLARTEAEPLFEDAGIADLLRHDGALYLYKGEKAFSAARQIWDLRAAHGIDFEHVSGNRLADLQPGLGASFTHATFVPQWLTVSDPYDVAIGIGKAAIAKGATLETAEVKSVAQTADGVSVALADGRTINTGQLVIAAGAWSHKLAAQLGHAIPLETERGYNTTFPKGAFDLKRQLVIPGDGFVITPLDTGLRIGGAVELGGLDRAPDYRRSEIMVEKTKAILPGLRTENGRQWMGFRPSLPDTIPVIGRSKKANRVIMAFGHGHLGLTQSAATARLVRDIALDQPLPIDIAPYRAERF
ncbi:NAD(P)/FAD-dependent oxidoreductase [Pelagibacterium lentulum]|uniref:D-amino-acid dehydrogenase n=1 Tax=Pelagibacterium lentulum TaxID=2029865 RepID=A0A916VUL0_9HYPH|nr:FAD-binding oxidoreductase [Pelagibacterium lentulum]GGA36478.1 D-amino-acid dehydrogenase [Pelagibacterium lentulum]